MLMYLPNVYLSASSVFRIENDQAIIKTVIFFIKQEHSTYSVAIYTYIAVLTSNFYRAVYV